MSRHFNYKEFAWWILPIIMVSSFTASDLQGMSYKLIFEGALDGYNEGQWLPSSKAFAIRALEGSKIDDNQLSSLYLYTLNEQNSFVATKVFPVEKSKMRGPVKVRYGQNKYEERLALCLKLVPGVDDLLCYRANWDNAKTENEMFYPYTLKEFEKPDFSSFIGPGEGYSGYSGLAHAYQSPKGSIALLTFRNDPGRNVLVQGSGEYFDFLNIYEFEKPIQSIAMSSNEELIYAITGQETEYHIWQAQISDPEFKLLPIDNSEFTIYTEIQVCPSNPYYISYLASNHTLRKQQRGIICVADVTSGEIIKKLEVFRHKQISSLQRNYHQWNLKGDTLFFLKSDTNDNIELWSWNLLTNTSSRANLQGISINGFSFSPDGKYLLVLTNDPAKNLRIYAL